LRDGLSPKWVLAARRRSIAIEEIIRPRPLLVAQLAIEFNSEGEPKNIILVAFRFLEFYTARVKLGRARFEQMSSEILKPPTSSGRPGMSQTCQKRTHATLQTTSFRLSRSSSVPAGTGGVRVDTRRPLSASFGPHRSLRGQARVQMLRRNAARGAGQL
jgi:hypothetical protein